MPKDWQNITELAKFRQIWSHWFWYTSSFELAIKFVLQKYLYDWGLNKDQRILFLSNTRSCNFKMLTFLFLSLKGPKKVFHCGSRNLNLFHILTFQRAYPGLFSFSLVIFKPFYRVKTLNTFSRFELGSLERRQACWPLDQHHKSSSCQ